MGMTYKKHFKTMTNLRFFVSIILASLYCFESYAQEMPPRPVSVSIVQSLSFGAFSNGMSGGMITITPFGMRYATGSVILIDMGYLYFPAIFRVGGNPGTILHILNGPDETLTGSNGGTLHLQVGESNVGDPIIINVAPPGTMEIRIGGKLTAGSPMANPPGVYNGSFTVIFVQE
jgi:hypothetical protein